MRKVKNLIFLFLVFILIIQDMASANSDKYDKLIENEQVYTKELKPWVLTIQHSKLPNLDGKWLVKRKRIKRTNTYLYTPVTNANCNVRLPFEERPLEKEVIVSAQGKDFFVFMAMFPVSNECFLNTEKTKSIEYENYSFKGVLISDEISYAYALRLVNHIENPAFPMQLWLNGKVLLEKVSDDLISGKGYEIEYTPECHGFIRNEIELEMTKSLLLSSNP